MISLYNILFTEAAKTIGDATANNMALYILREGGYVNLVLYDANLFYKIKKQDNDQNFFANNPVYGYIILRNDLDDCKSYMVAKVVAKEKYGPLMYDLGMSVTNSSLMSDRGKVSDKAQTVWDYMFSHPEKYKQIKLTNQRDCNSYLDGHDKAVKLITKIPYSNLMLNHGSLVNKLIREFNDSYEKQLTEELLLELGEYLFNEVV